MEGFRGNVEVRMPKYSPKNTKAILQFSVSLVRLENPRSLLPTTVAISSHKHHGAISSQSWRRKLRETSN
jgi:porphobilinogen deaminase